MRGATRIASILTIIDGRAMTQTPGGHTTAGMHNYGFIQYNIMPSPPSSTVTAQPPLASEHDPAVAAQQRQMAREIEDLKTR